MAKTAQDKRDSRGGQSLPAARVPAPAASNATTGAVPPPSGSQSVAVPAGSVVTSQMKPLCTSDLVAQFNGTGDPLLEYTPEGGFTNDDSILKAIDLVEDTPANNYLSDAKMARLVDKGTLKSVHFQRVKVFQLVVNLINAAQAIVGASTAITLVKENYERLMNSSLDALFKLNGGTMDLGNNASRESRHQELKHYKIVKVPKFDVMLHY